MSLTAGTTLQNGKYLIQTVLHQTDASVSYQATHTSLNHAVVIHTLNPSLRQLPRFPLLCQQFLATVKQGGLKAAIVRDCFEENEMPYAVLEPTPTPIQITDWMPFLTAAVLTVPTANSSAAATPAIAPPQPPVAPQLPAVPTQSPAGNEALNPAPPRPTPVRDPVPSRFPRWLPIALLLTACTTGLTGAAIGWKLRNGAASASAPALFNREQSFPEETDWLGEDPYAESDSDGNTFDSASPAIERRSSSSTRRQRAIEPEPEYEPRPRTRSRPRRIERSSPEQPDSQPEPQAETKPEAEAPKLETFSEPDPQLEAPPAPVAPAAPEAPPAPVEIPSPKVQLAPPAEPISQ